MTPPVVSPYLARLVAASLAEQWAPLPTGPDDEHHWASPVYWVSTLGRVAWCAPHLPPGHRHRAGLKAIRLDRPAGGRKKPHRRVNLSARDVGPTAQPRDPRTGRYLPTPRPVRGRYIPVRVCRLVLAAFTGPGSGLEPLACHGPGGSLDDSLRNLTRGTYRENLLDAYARGEREPGDDADLDTAAPDAVDGAHGEDVVPF